MRSRLRAGALAAALALALTGCGAAPDRNGGGGGSGGSGDDSLPYKIELADEFNENAHFSWAYTQYTTSWDPTKSVGGGDMSFYYPAYDRLLQMSPEGAPEPMLAESFEESDDGLTLTLKLREGLTFSDGTPFNAEAVKFNLERGAAEGSSIRAEVAQFQSAEVVDENTVKVTVAYGLGAYALALSYRGGIMISPTAVESGAIANGPAGIGPYQVTEIVPGDRLEFEKTPDYWDPDAQRVATMTYRLMTDDQARFNALQSGEVDGAFINPNQISATQNNPDLQLVSRPSTSFVYFMVNPTKAPFDNPKVREALNYAVDREAIAQGLYDGHCSAGIQPWPEGTPGYSEEVGSGLDIWPHDPEKAKQILEEEGVTDLTFTGIATNITQYTQLAEALQQQFAQAGITMNIKPAPTPEIIQEFVLNQSVEANINPYTGIPDPHGVLARHYLPGGTYSFGEQMSPDLVQTARDAAGPIDPAERTPLYEEVVQGLIDTPHHNLPLCQVHLTSAFNSNVSNVEQLVAGVPTLRGVAVSD